MILIDDGPGSSSLISHPPLDELSLLCHLPSPPFSEARADFEFSGCGPNSTTLKIGGEVKEETEFASSLKSGRFQATQAPALLNLYHIRWLVIITGSNRANPKTGVLQVRRQLSSGIWGWVDWSVSGSSIPYDYVHNFLSSPSFTEYKDESGEGIRAVTVYDKSRAAQWIANLYHTWQRRYEDHASMKVLDRSGNRNGLTEQDVKARMRALHDPRMQDPGFVQRVRSASSLPGVSYHRALGLAEEFASVQEMISPACTCPRTPERAQEEERRWKRADKIGKKTAEEIGRAVR